MGKDEKKRDQHAGQAVIRQSNFELLRILAMFSIVAHHFVVNSGIQARFEQDGISMNMFYLQAFGMWGKIAINVFVLITGYFMCNSKLTVRRLLKIYLEVLFYRYLIYLILLLAGYETFDYERINDLVFATVKELNNGFAASFLAVYLFIPFYNLLIEQMTQKQFKIMLVLLLGIQTVAESFFFNETVFSRLTWYMTLYFLAAYIRRHARNSFTNNKVCVSLFLLGIVISVSGIYLIDLMNLGNAFLDPYLLVMDSNKFMALFLSVLAFLICRNLEIPYSRVINTVASLMFGVLLIHGASDAMRRFLWKDFLRVPELYDKPFWELAGVSFLMTFGVFAVCALMDYFRVVTLERPLFRYLETKDFCKKELY